MVGGHRRLFGNSAALAFGQILNFLPNLILIPYLLLELGVDGYAIVAFGLAAYVLVTTLADAGTIVTGTHSIASSDSESVVGVASNLVSARILLGSAGCLVMVLSAVSGLVGDSYITFILIMSFSVPGYLLVPIWYFRGIQRPVVAVLLMAGGRVVYLTGSWILVEAFADPIWVAVAHGISWWAVAGASNLLMFRHLADRHIHVSLNRGLQTIRKGLGFAGSGISWAAYFTSGTLLLGHFGTPLQLAAYSVPEQGYRAIRLLRDSVAEAVFPVATKDGDWRLVLALSRRMTLLVIGFCLVAGSLIPIALPLFAEDAALGQVTVIAYVFLLILALDTSSSFWGYPLFAALGRVDLVNACIAITATFQVSTLLLVQVTVGLTAIGASLVSVLSTILLLVSLRLRARRPLRDQRDL